MLQTLAVAGFRSLRDVALPLGPLTVITGPNGSGKSNLYRALRLLADAADGRLIASLAREGGLDATRWAGRASARDLAVAVKLGFGGDPFGYAIDLGLPIPSSTLFGRDPGIKREVVWAGTALRPAATLLDRRNGAVRGRVDGDWHVLRADLEPTDSVFDAPEAVATPEVIALRDQIRTWRFYEQLRTDADAPARRVWPGTRTWALAADGADLASAWQTIAESGDDDVQTACVDDAFPGARVEVVATQGRFALEVSQPGLLRPLGAEELSDGTLRYLAWIAALLSPRPPALLVLNEPETSLHPSVIPALARLIARAARRTQVIVVSHAGALVEALAGDALCHEFHKRDGATEVVGQGLVARPSWRWPER